MQAVPGLVSSVLVSTVISIIAIIPTSVARAQTETETTAATTTTTSADAAAHTSTTAASTQGGASSHGEALEEIVVTAQRRRENLQVVPLSVATLDREQITSFRAAGDDVRFLAARVPSLNIESSFGRTFPRFYIRGLGNTDFDLNASQPVLFVLDDVVLENPTLKGFPIFDVDRIEVLRGPQGTLFGRNTPAGVVKFESTKPKDTPEGYARFSYGTFNTTAFEGAANTPIGDLFRARLSVLYERRDDWVDNTFTEREDVLEGFRDAAGRFQLLFKPNEKASALLNVHVHSLNGTARLFRANIIKPGTNDLVDDFDIEKVSQDGQNQQKVDQLGLALTGNYDFGPVSFLAIFGMETAKVYSRGDIDGGFGAAFAGMSGPGVIPFPSESADGIPHLQQLTGEVRVLSNRWEKLNFVTGLFIFREDLDIESFSYDSLNNGAQNGYAKQNQLSTSFGLYGSLTYDVLEELRLAAGIRWSDDAKDFRADRLQSPIGGGTIGPLLTNPKANFVSWDASATYFINKDVNVYVRGASSFRAPSIQGRILFSDSLSQADSEKILSVEAGIKSEFFDKRARINLAGYRYQLDDQQLTAVGGAANVNTLLNADKTVGYGFEADVQLLPFSNLLLTGGVSFNKTSIEDDNLAVAPCGAMCTVNDPMGPVMGTVLLKGNPLPNAPQWVADVTMRLALPISTESELFAFTDWAYRSKVSFFLYDSVEFTGKPLLEGGVRIGYTRYDGQMELSAFVRNLLDNHTVTGGIDFNNLTGFVNEPRVVGVQGLFRF